MEGALASSKLTLVDFYQDKSVGGREIGNHMNLNRSFVLKL